MRRSDIIIFLLCLLFISCLCIVKNIKPSDNTTIIVPYNNVQYNDSCECNKK